mmetsp:Transcript_55601/g.81234  ORF Transcript_55601/g.81234 Transcript_55601/m.81234 type:complete len:144 (-) Transcript_55601:249-680(-)
MAYIERTKNGENNTNNDATTKATTKDKRLLHCRHLLTPQPHEPRVALPFPFFFFAVLPPPAALDDAPPAGPGPPAGGRARCFSTAARSTFFRQGFRSTSRAPAWVNVAWSSGRAFPVIPTIFASGRIFNISDVAVGPSMTGMR